MKDIRVETVIDYPTYRDYFLHQITTTKRMRLFFVLSGVAALLMAASFILAWSNETALTVWDYVPLLILVGVYLFYGLFFGLMTKRQYERNKETFTFKTEYFFHTDHVSITGDGHQEEAGLQVPYDQFGAAVETVRYIYLYVDVQRCYILRKDGIELGRLDELRELLKATIKGPYQQSKKSLKAAVK